MLSSFLTVVYDTKTPNRYNITIVSELDPRFDMTKSSGRKKTTHYLLTVKNAPDLFNKLSGKFAKNKKSEEMFEIPNIFEIIESMEEILNEPQYAAIRKSMQICPVQQKRYTMYKLQMKGKLIPKILTRSDTADSTPKESPDSVAQSVSIDSTPKELVSVDSVDSDLKESVDANEGFEVLEPIVAQSLESAEPKPESATATESTVRVEQAPKKTDLVDLVVAQSPDSVVTQSPDSVGSVSIAAQSASRGWFGGWL